MAGTRKDSGEGERARQMPLPSPAMAVALLALFVAMGGSAWAVTKVGTNQIKNNAVTTAKIKPGAVNASRLGSGAVTGSKLAVGSVGGSNVAVQQIAGDPVTVLEGSSQIVTATCPEGKTAISAGFEADLGAVWAHILYVAGPTAYVYPINPTGTETSAQVNATAVCL